MVKTHTYRVSFDVEAPDELNAKLFALSKAYGIMQRSSIDRVIEAAEKEMLAEKLIEPEEVTP